MRSRTLVAVPAFALAATLVVGCTAPATPKQALADSITKTGQGKSLSTTMRLDTTAADLQKVLTAVSDEVPAASQQATVDAVTAIIPKVAVAIKLHSTGADLSAVKDPAAVDASFAVSVDGKPAELLWAQSKAFLHADVIGIGAATGLFTATQVSMLTGSMSAQMPWIKDVIAGSWVALDDASVRTAIDDMKAQNASASPSASLDAAKASAAFTDASEVTKVNDTTFQVVTDVKKLVRAAAAVDPADEFTDAKADEALAKINDGANLDTTVTVADGRVTKAVVNLADVLRTWPKADSTQPAIAKLAASDFKLDGVIEISADDPKLVVPSAASTIPATDLEGLFNS